VWSSGHEPEITHLHLYRRRLERGAHAGGPAPDRRQIAAGTLGRPIERVALVSDDSAAARKLMRGDMTFQGPLDTFHTADEYLEAIKRLAAIIERIDLQKVFAHGEDVCVLYDMVTNTPAGTAFIAEWYQVQGGKIAALRAVFDARPFAALFGR
jgi:hypothetical protein